MRDLALEVQSTRGVEEERRAIERVGIKRLARGQHPEAVYTALHGLYRRWLDRHVIRMPSRPVTPDDLIDGAEILTRQFLDAVRLGTYDKEEIEIPFGAIRQKEDRVFMIQALYEIAKDRQERNDGE